MPVMKRPIITTSELMPLTLAENLYDFLNGGMPESWWKLWTAQDIVCKFNREGEDHDPACYCMSCDALNYIKTKEFCAELAHVAGTGPLKPGVLFVSHYGKGHICDTHSDKGNGDISFVWNLTKRWSVDYGGNLEIGDLTIVPTFNQVNLFDVSGEGRFHRVSEVLVPWPRRLAVAGWYWLC